MNCNANGCSLFMQQQNQQTIIEGLLTGGFCMRLYKDLMFSDWMCILYDLFNE